MKYLLTLLLMGSYLTGFCHRTTYEKLTEVNKCWTEQTDAVAPATAPPGTQTETDWIRLHLSLVEQTLRARGMAHLTPAQRQNRLRTLDHLHEYWQAGNFPVNDAYNYRTPIFIDKYDNFCAVGYLMKATGYEGISRMVAAKTNLAYVRQMNYPELAAWANDFGFTTDELAWIQPAYPPVKRGAAIGKGTDGEVLELYPDEASGKLYVGGKFTMVDSTITANNIAYVTEAGGVYTWHNMGNGVNGAVHAVQVFDNKVFVAGTFTEAGILPANNVAYWDGSSWTPAGCTFGTIKDLIVFGDELYAVGNFDVCATSSEVNFARWDGNNWQHITGLDGHVNTVEPVDNYLVLGGAFSYMGGPEINVIKWHPNDGFLLYGSSIANEVNDLQVYKDTLYAACRQTSSNDSMLLQKLVGGTWVGVDAFPSVQYYKGPAISYNTLLVHGDTLILGGEFNYSTLSVPGTMVFNSVNVFPRAGTWVNVDSAVNKIVIFKDRQISGGKFKYNYDWSPAPPALNGIAYKETGPTSVNELPRAAKLQLYPNPAGSGSSIRIENDFSAEVLRLRDVSGKVVLQAPVTAGTTTVALPQLAAGTYFAELSSKAGESRTEKLIIK